MTRDSVNKQRSDCSPARLSRSKRKNIEIYPEEFEKVWGSRKVSDYSGRKAAGFAVFLLMKKRRDEENTELKRVLLQCFESRWKLHLINWTDVRHVLTEYGVLEK